MTYDELKVKTIDNERCLFCDKSLHPDILVDTNNNNKKMYMYSCLCRRFCFQFIMRIIDDEWTMQFGVEPSSGYYIYSVIYRSDAVNKTIISHGERYILPYISPYKLDSTEKLEKLLALA